MANYNPTITAVMISLNDEKIIEACLSSIRKQDYCQDLIKIVILDGGSTDNTVSIAKKYNADVIVRSDLKDSPNIRGGIALTTAKSDLILFLSADNRLQEDSVLSTMVHALADQEIVACETLRYGFHQSDPLLSRYFALIGGNDPIAVGLGKADRGPYDRDDWHGYGEAVDCDFYYKVSFQKDAARIPTIGANGFLIKRKFLDKTNMARNCLHIDMCVELILLGHNKFSFLKDKHVIHFIDLKLFAFLKRRLLFANIYHSDNMKRTYAVFHRRDFLKLIINILCNITVLIPLLRAFKGYFNKRDVAWFLHPIVCFTFTVGYSIFFAKRYLIGAGNKL